jgi:hypothetical protein
MALTRWEGERAGLMQEIKEVQAYNRKEFALAAVTNFKHLLFRYRALNILNKLTKL